MRSLLAAIFWLIFISILFFLPGSALPKTNWLGTIHFDKWVHVAFFAILAWFWAMAMRIKTGKHLVLMIIIAGLYGLLVEVIQDQFIANRSFDGGDLAADVAGTCLGCLYWYRGLYKKNKPL
jgi:VanZ family protein